MNVKPKWLGFSIAALATVFTAGCATPANDVVVETMPMREALQKARSEAPRKDPNPRPHRPGLITTAYDGKPVPLVSAPDIRLAWIDDFVDSATGARWFGSWVAIPVDGFHWVTEQGRSPLDGSRGVRTPFEGAR